MAWVDGALGPLAAATVPVTDRGFLWGDHVFEVMRAVSGRLVDGGAHLDRLQASAARCRHPPLDRPAIEAAVAATLAAAELDDAAVRVVVTRGDAAGLAPAVDARARVVVTVEPLALGPVTGVRLHPLAGDRDGLVPAAAKAGSYLGSILALAAARDAGADDALLHHGDRVVETATGSVLVVRGGVVWSPTGPSLPGITAARVLALLADHGRAVRTGPLDRAAVDAADELWVTSARRGVRPVVALGARRWTPGPVFDEAAALHAAWIERVRGQGVADATLTPPAADAERARGL